MNNKPKKQIKFWEIIKEEPYDVVCTEEKEDLDDVVPPYRPYWKRTLDPENAIINFVPSKEKDDDEEEG